MPLTRFLPPKDKLTLQVFTNSLVWTRGSFWDLYRTFAFSESFDRLVRSQFDRNRAVLEPEDTKQRISKKTFHFKVGACMFLCNIIRYMVHKSIHKRFYELCDNTIPSDFFYLKWIQSFAIKIYKWKCLLSNKNKMSIWQKSLKLKNLILCVF